MSLLPDIHFEISERKVLLRIMDLLSIFIALLLISDILDFNYFIITSKQWFWAILLAIYFTIFATIFEMYDLKKADSFQNTLKNILLSVFVTVLFYLFTPFLSPELPENRFQILVFSITMIAALILWRLAYVTLISSPRFNKRVIVVGDSFDINVILRGLQDADPNYKVVGFVNTDQNSQASYDEVPGLKKVSVNDLMQEVKELGASEIVVASSTKGVSLPLYNELISMLEDGFSIREYTQVYEEVTNRVPVNHVERDFYKYFPFSRNSKNRFYIFFHRLFDILFACAGILVLITLLPLVLLGNLVANRGVLFYEQERTGLNGKPFVIVKYRTMIRDAEKDGARYSYKGDSRITPFGRFLRNSRLDELPQCFNILKGEMSLIGPRPERPIFVEKLSSKIPFYEIRHVVRPGLTGWAQVKGRYASTDDDALEKLQYDLYYIKNRSLFLDLNIILKTISTVIFYRGQ